jgi:hypothetical protein
MDTLNEVDNLSGTSSTSSSSVRATSLNSSNFNQIRHFKDIKYSNIVLNHDIDTQNDSYHFDNNNIDHMSEQYNEDYNIDFSKLFLEKLFKEKCRNFYVRF